MEKDQETAKRNAAFLSAVIALTALSSFLVDPVLEYIFPNEDKLTRKLPTVIHNASTNAPNTVATNIVQNTRH